MIRKWTTFLFFWPKNLDYCQTVKHQHPSFFLVYIRSISIQIRALVDSPYLQARVTKKDVTKLYKTRPDQQNWSAISPLFSPAVSTWLYSPCYVTPSYILLYHPTLFFLLSSVCLKTNEEIFKHWTTLCSERNLIHWHIMTLYTRTDVTILCYNVTNVDVSHLNELQWSDHHG